MKTEKSNNINNRKSKTTHPGSEASQSGSISSMQAMERKLQKADRKQASLYLFCNFISLMLISAYAAMMFSPTVLDILPEGGDSRKQMYAIFVLSLFGCVVFTIYAASLFFRKKTPVPTWYRRFFALSYCLEKCSLPTPQRGHTQLSGTLSQAVPGATPLSGSPSAGSYT